ncbi:MAG TPA: PIG-L family deacetylase, partial [Candidatus Saccharimonadales bacterium]
LLRWVSITHISSNAGAGPFGFVHSMHDVALGSVYAVLGLFANFGANPAAQVSILRQVPHEVLKGLSSIGALAFAVNLALTLAGFYVVLRFVLQSYRKPVPQAPDVKTPGIADGLSLMLVATTIVSLVMFVVSDHYYPVDARYLQIAVFAVFVVSVTYLRHRQWQTKRLILVGLLLFLSVAFGVVPAWRSYHAEKIAMDTVNTRNQKITPILSGHHADTLVGDYWRVMPVKLSTHGAVHVLPLSGCTQAQSILSSQTWQVDLRKQKFAYLLTLDGATLTGYSKCTLQQIITAYGRPDSSVLVAGSLNNPKEMVLFYDRGTDAAKQAAVKRPDSKTETVLPTPLSKLYPASCTSTTIMNIVAHQDDDLLFINPDTLHALRSGSCLRTIYVTAGDDGNGEAYWLSREKGAEAAYSAMLGLNNVWTQRTVELPTGQFLTIANPQHNQTVSLIFMRLPDGNVSGNGFASTHHATIARLAAEGIGSIRSVDGQSTYNLRQLIDALAAIMGAYSSAEIRTQSTVSGRGVRDHSDHSTVGNLAMAAYELYSAQKPGTTLKYYRGYAIRAEQQNVFDDDLAAKQAAFLAYAKYDGSVCQTEEECASSDNNYSAYLRREYETIR